jgi:hypothetical protein
MARRSSTKNRLLRMNPAKAVRPLPAEGNHRRLFVPKALFLLPTWLHAICAGQSICIVHRLSSAYLHLPLLVSATVTLMECKPGHHFAKLTSCQIVDLPARRRNSFRYSHYMRAIIYAIESKLQAKIAMIYRSLHNL